MGEKPTGAVLDGTGKEDAMEEIQSMADEALRLIDKEEGMNVALSQNVWITIKTLQDSGSSNQEIAKFLNMTTGKVSVATKSESYEDYKNACYLISKRAAEARKANKSKKKEEVPAPAPAPAVVEEKPKELPVQVVEHRQSITIQATHYMMEVLNEQLKMLKTISAKLALIVDDLCGEKKEES